MTTRRAVASLAVAALAAVAATPAAATVVSLSIDYDHIAPLQFQYPPDPLATPWLTRNVIYEVPVYFQITGAPLGQTFGSLLVDVHRTAFTNAPFGLAPTYYGNDSVFPQGKGLVPYFETNADGGASNSDLLDIFASISAGVTTGPRLTMGMNSPYLLGYVYLYLPNDAVGFPSANFTLTSYSYNQGGVIIPDPQAQLVGTTLFPEPSALSLAAALIPLAWRRRRSRASLVHG